MKKIMIEKTKKEAKLFFLNLFDVDVIERIISLFNAEYFFGECFLEKEDLLESDYFESNEETKILYVENKRKHKQLIIGVPKKFLKEFIGIAEKFNTTLTGNSGGKDDWELFLANRGLKGSDVGFDINDNNGSCIRFNTENYDYDDTIAKIKAILD